MVASNKLTTGLYSTIEVEVGAKKHRIVILFNKPGLTRESMERVLLTPYRPSQPDLEIAYKRLRKFQPKSGLNSHVVANKNDIQLDNLQNTQSYSKIKNLIFTHAHKNILSKNERKAGQIEQDEKMKREMEIFWVVQLLESDLFHLLTCFVIAVQAAVIAIRSNTVNATTAMNYTLGLSLDIVFILFFSLEIGLVLVGRLFFKNKWNIVKLLILIAEIVTISCPAYPAIHVFGILRIFGWIKKFKSRKLSQLFTGINSTITILKECFGDIINIVILVVCLTYFWASVGFVLFGKAVPLDFGSLQSSFFTLFVAITQIGWIETFEELLRKGFGTEAFYFYLSYFIIVVFIISKIIVAVIVSKLEDFHRHLIEQKKQRHRKLKSTEATLSGNFSMPIVSIPPKDSATWRSQIPFEVPNFDNISKAKVENYFLVLSIMEENLKEYMDIVAQLKAIQAEVKEMSNMIKNENEMKLEQSLDVKGDVLSTLIKRTSTIRSIKPGIKLI